MNLRFWGGLTVSAVAACIAACTSDNSTDDTTTDAGTRDAGTTTDAPTSTAALAITPTTAKVLTCDSLQLKETGGAGNGTWSVSPATGTISSSGLYTAPVTVPTVPAVGVTYTEGTQTASAQLTVAAAFVGTPSLVPIGTTEIVQNIPFDHQLTASGSQIYAGLANTDNLHFDIFGSSDNGATFTKTGSYHTGNLGCATVAVDAGDPNVVYLAYYAGHGDSTSNTGATVRLAVSLDGAKTFPTEYVLADSENSIANLICPDVVSPSADHVVVIGANFHYGFDNSPAHVSTWTSSARGVGIGPVGTPLTCTNCPTDGSTFYAPSDTNAGTAETTAGILSDGNGYAARGSTNGKGGVCIAFQYDGGNAPNPTEVQCSTDNGATWTAPKEITAPTASGKIHPTIAVSPSGNVAVAWLDTVGTADQSFVAFSTDGGKTFGTPVQYPALTDADNFGVSDPVVAWESDDILWLSETSNLGNFPTIFVDKTCDMGKTWNGAVQVERGTATSLLKTTNGMVVGSANTSTPSLGVISLNAQ